MKKIKFLPYRLQALYKVSFIILFFSLVGRPTYAESSDGKINDKSIQNQTTSGHSIELNGIGLAYSYEYAFSRNSTFQCRKFVYLRVDVRSGRKLTQRNLHHNQRLPSDKRKYICRTAFLL